MLLIAAGSISLLPLWLSILQVWANDPLRSIGAVFPFFAAAGVILAWRRLRWSMDGRLWALLLVAAALPLARVVTVSSFLINAWLGLLHPGLVLFLFGVGTVLLFGGPRLLRASIAPLCLLLFIDPVPRAFNSLVDLPLQHLSATTARGFSRLIGLHPTGDQLRMMFAPRFGMMIVPGCNGVRGSVTLGYLALIFGYSRRLRPVRLAVVVLASVLLGYVLNLLRLCLLVVYYRIGVTFPSMQKHGTGLDYIIGCTLFLFATLSVGLFIRLMEPSSPPATTATTPAMPFGYAAAMRAVLFVALTLTFIVPELRSHTQMPALRPNEQHVLSSFPIAVGPYRLARTYAEHDPYGNFTLAMADYSVPGDLARNFTLGVWVGSGNHFVAKSKYLQGVTPVSNSSFDTVAQASLPVHFVTSFYDDGVSRRYDAESACSTSSCSEHLVVMRHGASIILSPAFADLAFQPIGNRLPILLRREWPDSDPTPSAALRAQFELDARLFTAQLDLRQLLLLDGTPPDN
jgi:exosortase J